MENHRSPESGERRVPSCALRRLLQIQWRTAHRTFAVALARAAGLFNEREAQANAVSELIVRARSGFKSVYGLDSTQYEQAGGTRKSDRKRPVRRSPLELKKAA